MQPPSPQAESGRALDSRGRAAVVGNRNLKLTNRPHIILMPSVRFRRCVRPMSRKRTNLHDTPGKLRLRHEAKPETQNVENGKQGYEVRSQTHRGRIYNLLSPSRKPSKNPHACPSDRHRRTRMHVNIGMWADRNAKTCTEFKGWGSLLYTTWVGDHQSNK